jgi:hypothetical protein
VYGKRGGKTFEAFTATECNEVFSLKSDVSETVINLDDRERDSLRNVGLQSHFHTADPPRRLHCILYEKEKVQELEEEHSLNVVCYIVRSLFC